MKKKYIIMLIFILVTLSIIACSNMVSQNNHTKSISGKIIEISDSSILILTDSKEQYSAALNNKTKFQGDIKKDLSIGDGVSILFNGIVAESYPMQITAMEVTVTDEAEDIISLDPREFVSGIIGQFPSIILDQDTTSSDIAANTPFAISLKVSPENNPWTYDLSSDKIILIGEGSLSTSGTVPIDYYWGFTIEEKGEFEIVFSNKDDRTVYNFKIKVN